MQPEHRPLGGKMILYRPVGSKELELIKKSNYRRFPPRLAEQPIFSSPERTVRNGDCFQLECKI